jgi:hypothetical protein
MRSRGALLAGLLLTMAAYAAPPRDAPPPEQLRAEKGSRFIENLMRERFSANHARTELLVAVLYSSGTHSDEARKLENAEQRRLLARLTGDSYEQPATIGDAIAREGSERIDGKPALERVTIDFAALATAGTAGMPPGAQEAAPGVWTTSRNQLVTAYVAVSIHNGLALAVRETGLQYGRQDGGRSLVDLYCPLARPIEPGMSATALCHGTDRTDRIDAIVHALSSRTPSGPFAAGWVYTAEVDDLSGRVEKEIRGDGPQRGAHAMLAGASCEDKGSCAVIAKADADRRKAEWRDRRGLLVVEFGMVAALVLGIVAAMRVREPGAGGWFVSTLAVAVVLYAIFTAAATYIAVMPHAGYAALPAVLLVIFGGVPYLIALAVVGISLLSNATSLRAFATAFGAAATVTVLAALFLSP